MPNQLRRYSVGVSAKDGLIELDLSIKVVLTSQAAEFLAEAVEGGHRIDDENLLNLLKSTLVQSEEKEQRAEKLRQAISYLNFNND